jgi:hypothetical protein
VRSVSQTESRVPLPDAERELCQAGVCVCSYPRLARRSMGTRNGSEARDGDLPIFLLKSRRS